MWHFTGKQSPPSASQREARPRCRLLPSHERRRGEHHHGSSRGGGGHLKEARIHVGPVVVIVVGVVFSLHKGRGVAGRAGKGGCLKCSCTNIVYVTGIQMACLRGDTSSGKHIFRCEHTGRGGGGAAAAKQCWSLWGTMESCLACLLNWTWHVAQTNRLEVSVSVGERIPLPLSFLSYHCSYLMWQSF